MKPPGHVLGKPPTGVLEKHLGKVLKPLEALQGYLGGVLEKPLTFLLETPVEAVLEKLPAAVLKTPLTLALVKTPTVVENSP